MKLDIRFDDTDFRIAAQRAVRELRADSRELIREEVRLFVKEWRARIPPFASYGKEKAGQDKKRGESAIRKDLRHVAAPMRLNSIRNERLKALMKKRDATGLEAFTEQMHDPFLARRTLLTYAQIKRVHKASRSKNRGRVYRENRHLITYKDWNKYAKEVQKKVGWNKAAFNRALIDTGARIPAYIARHGPRGGYFETGIGEKFSATLTGTVNVPGAQVAVNQALALRGKKLHAEVRRVIRQLERTGKIQSRRKSFNARLP